MNFFDEKTIDEKSFAYRDLIGQDKWTAWTVVFGALTVVGTPTYVGRYRIVGKQCFFQVKLSAATSIASTAGVDYLTSPFTMMGLGGMATMSNDTSNVAEGVCHVDVATSRIYLPSQVASGNIFSISGWFEI